jgi:hypothetical protein
VSLAGCPDSRGPPASRGTTQPRVGTVGRRRSRSRRPQQEGPLCRPAHRYWGRTPPPDDAYSVRGSSPTDEPLPPCSADSAAVVVVVREGPAVGDRARRPDGASVRRGEVDDVAAQAGVLCTSGARHVEVELPRARRSSFRAAADRAGSLDGPGARRARSRCRRRAVRLSVTGLRNGRQLGKAALRRTPSRWPQPRSDRSPSGALTEDQSGYSGARKPPLAIALRIRLRDRSRRSAITGDVATRGYSVAPNRITGACEKRQRLTTSTLPSG